MRKLRNQLKEEWIWVSSWWGYQGGFDFMEALKASAYGVLIGAVFLAAVYFLV